MSKKKAAEAKMAAKAAGMPIDDNYKEDVFELQHHHLLRCLEKTTVSRFSVSYLLVAVYIIQIHINIISEVCSSLALGLVTYQLLKILIN